MSTREDNKAPVESLAVATIKDTMAGGDAVVGDVAVATGGADPQMNRLLSRLEHMKTSRKLLVGNLSKENIRANRRTVARYKRQAKRPMVRTSLFLPSCLPSCHTQSHKHCYFPLLFIFVSLI